MFYSTMVIYFPLTNGLQNYIEGKHQSFYNEESWETWLEMQKPHKYYIYHVTNY